MLPPKPDRTIVREFENPFNAVAFIMACILLGIGLPTCAVLIFTDWLDPLFQTIHPLYH
jgi:hypothetical protein